MTIQQEEQKKLIKGFHKDCPICRAVKELQPSRSYCPTHDFELKEKTMEEPWEIEARRVFNPYAMELEFDEKDWRVFLNRLQMLLDFQRKQIKEEVIEEIIKAIGNDEWSPCGDGEQERLDRNKFRQELRNALKKI